MRVGTTIGRQEPGRYPPRDPNPLSRLSTPWMSCPYTLDVTGACRRAVPPSLPWWNRSGFGTSRGQNAPGARPRVSVGVAGVGALDLAEIELDLGAEALDGGAVAHELREGVGVGVLVRGQGLEAGRRGDVLADGPGPAGDGVLLHGLGAEPAEEELGVGLVGCVPERTPNARASYDAVATTWRGLVGSPSPPTMTGRPASSGRRSTSTAARNWSRSTCRIHPRSSATTIRASSPGSPSCEDGLPGANSDVSSARSAGRTRPVGCSETSAGSARRSLRRSPIGPEARGEAPTRACAVRDHACSAADRSPRTSTRAPRRFRRTEARLRSRRWRSTRGRGG